MITVCTCVKRYLNSYSIFCVIMHVVSTVGYDREDTGIVVTTHFHHLPHLSKVAAATTPLMEARVVTNEMAFATETTTMHHGNNFGGYGG